MKNVLQLAVFLFWSHVASAQVPQVTAVSPVSLRPYGTAPVTLKVYGTQFSKTSVVTWNGSPLATKFISVTELTATLPAADLAEPGTGIVSVTDADTLANFLQVPVTGVGQPSYTQLPRPGHESTVSFAAPLLCDGTMDVAGWNGGAGRGPVIFVPNSNGIFAGGSGGSRYGTGTLLAAADLTNSGWLALIGEQKIAVAVEKVRLFRHVHRPEPWGTTFGWISGDRRRESRR